MTSAFWNHLVFWELYTSKQALFRVNFFKKNHLAIYQDTWRHKEEPRSERLERYMLWQDREGSCECDLEPWASVGNDSVVFPPHMRSVEKIVWTLRRREWALGGLHSYILGPLSYIEIDVLICLPLRFPTIWLWHFFPVLVWEVPLPVDLSLYLCITLNTMILYLLSVSLRCHDSGSARSDGLSALTVAHAFWQTPWLRFSSLMPIEGDLERNLEKTKLSN
jgi:hypothetical protein